MNVKQEQGCALALVLGISNGYTFALTDWRLWDDGLADAVWRLSGTLRERGVVLTTLRGRPEYFPQSQNYLKPTGENPTLGYIASCLAAV